MVFKHISGLHSRAVCRTFALYDPKFTACFRVQSSFPGSPTGSPGGTTGCSGPNVPFSKFRVFASFVVMNVCDNLLSTLLRCGSRDGVLRGTRPRIPVPVSSIDLAIKCNNLRFALLGGRFVLALHPAQLRFVRWERGAVPDLYNHTVRALAMGRN
jgi:hypothetical protein